MCEDMEFFKMLKRMIRAGGKRAAYADEIELAEYHNLKILLDEEIKKAVKQQIKDGKSWSDIGDALGISRQAAFKKYSK